MQISSLSLGKRSESQTRDLSIFLAGTIALFVFASGIFNIYSVIGPSLPQRMESLRVLLPLEVIHFSRTLVLLLGFLQAVVAIQILKRKRRAWWLSVGLTLLAVVLHLAKGWDYEEATVAVGLAVGLYLSRSIFTVRSREILWRNAALRSGIWLGLTVAYGVVGFWLLESKEFGIDFHWGAAFQATLAVLLFDSAPMPLPQTSYAAWFLDSLEGIGLSALIYAAWNLFRPVYFRFRIQPSEMMEAAKLVSRHGRSSQDFFKYNSDKSFFFSKKRDAFLAYRVGLNVAIVLGDPVGPDGVVGELIAKFQEYCRDNGWSVTFHQASEAMLPVYRLAGLKELKLGDNAVVELDQFTLEGKRGKAFRAKLKQFEREGITAMSFPAPVPEHVLEEAEEVSNEWLTLPGKRERQFTLGRFDRDYLRGTEILAAYDAEGKMLGFVNFIPCPRPEETTLDLMRRRAGGPNGIIDFLFIRSFELAKSRGFTRFCLGMAPMGGFQPSEKPSLEARAIHAFFQKLTFVFSFQGLKAYKAKFATRWEPLYVIYESSFDLPRLPLALARISEYKEEE